MGAPLNIAVTLRATKGSPLTSDEQDGNIQALVAAIQKVATTGVGASLATAEFDPNTGIVTLLDTNNAVMGTFPLPPRPIRLAGRWAAATAYKLGDLVRIEATTTVPRGLSALAPADFISDAADPAKDIAAGKLVAVAYDGKPAQTQRGTYVDGATYVPGDVVFFPPTGTYYQMYLAGTPAGSKPNNPLQQADGTYTFPWGPVSLPAYRALRVRADGKPAAGALVQREMMDRYCQIGVNFTGALQANISLGPNSIVKSKTAPAAAAQLTVKLNGVAVGYIAFAAGSSLAGFATVNAQPVNVSPGDLLEVFAPTTQDTALADIYGYLTIIQY
ncbi:hypothetical protein MKK88_21225 [Methylobacterium sp. E-005]|uniref:hypothetical protein n=1 Tax=Methylobacterium sp. E-005 TaxID=2836549 RepID=UPI001FB978FF|nr:hypothetical protein [Methylobacterium sp. E-005]MCJ2088483.1 hypothetical protein [Methylobacterium sp. E-005]